ncbi:MAG: hypothetical protein AAB393_13100 [Bacteroidota bacterium]
MKKNTSSILFLVVLAVLVALTACSDNPGTQALPAGETDLPTTDLAFTYTGYARNGSVIVRGSLAIFRRDSVHFGGHWHLRALVDTMRIGPQHGVGRLIGQLRNGVLSINHNPDHVDNNVILHGRFTRARFEGEWQWVGFAGVLNSGRFQALRRPGVEIAE